MYASIDFATKSALRQAVLEGQPIVAYSPNLGMPEIRGMTTIVGPWKPSKINKPWKARVRVEDMRVVKVH